jgi:hypothetical protein
MHRYHLEAMAQCVIDAGLLIGTADTQARLKPKLVEALASYWEDKIASVSTREDVLDRAEDMGIELSDADADLILENVLEDLDSHRGSNWDVIESQIIHFQQVTDDGREEADAKVEEEGA